MTALQCARRRTLLGRSLLAAVCVCPALSSVASGAAARASPLSLQLSTPTGIAQAGEVVARHLGYYLEEGVDLTIRPGGLMNDGLVSVASGRADFGQMSSSPTLLAAIAQGLPARCFAVGAQRHPFCFFSRPDNPVRTPASLQGKKVGLPPSAFVLLRAVLARNGMTPKDVAIIPTSISTPLLWTRQADVVTGWSTNVAAIRSGAGEAVQMALWDAGVRLYGLPYYASTAVLQTRARELESFLRATARGWRWAASHPDEAADLVVDLYPATGALARQSLRVMMGFTGGGTALAGGWGAMDPAFWAEQIETLASLGELPSKLRLDDVITLKLLDTTRSARMLAQ